MTLRAVLEASGGIGDALRGTAAWLASVPRDHAEGLARKVLAAARGRALLTAAAAASAAAGHANPTAALPTASLGSPLLVPQPPHTLVGTAGTAGGGGVWSTPGLYGTLHSHGSSVGLHMFEGLLAGALAERLPLQSAAASPLMRRASVPQVVWANSPRDEAIGRSLHAPPPGATAAAAPASAAASPWFGGARGQARPRAIADSVLTASVGGGGSTLSPGVIAPAPAHEMPPEFSLGAAAPAASVARSGTGGGPVAPFATAARSSRVTSDESVAGNSSDITLPTSARRRGSVRSAVSGSILAQRRGSRLASDYETRTGGGSRDVRLSAALLNASDVAALQLLSASLASESGGGGSGANPSPSVAGSYRLLGTIAEVAELPPGALDRVASAGPGGASSALGGAGSEPTSGVGETASDASPLYDPHLGGSPAAAAPQKALAAAAAPPPEELPAAMISASDGLRAALAAGAAAPAALAPPRIEPRGDLTQQQLQQQQQFAEALYAAAATAQRTAGGSTDVLNARASGGADCTEPG